MNESTVNPSTRASTVVVREPKDGGLAIGLNDFRSEPAELRDSEVAAARRVIESGRWILGEEVREFERAWSAFLKVPHCVGTGNGLDAIEIGLRASGIGPGDEVITTSMTAFATVLAILRAGAVPVLADIDPDTSLLDIDSAARCVTRRTRGVLLVHLYGQMAQMDRWTSFCTHHGLDLWEDCAQAHGAAFRGHSAGSLGTWGAYSFYPTKNLGAIGDGGALVTKNAEIAAAAVRLRNYGQEDRYRHTVLGLNSRLDEMQAAILTVRLAWLENWIMRRREIAKAYSEGISNPRVVTPPMPEDLARHVFHLFVLRCPDRDALMRHLADRGVNTLVHYPVPVHLQPVCSDVARDSEGLPNAERHARECMSLPCHPQMSDEAVHHVIDAVNNSFAS